MTLQWIPSSGMLEDRLMDNLRLRTGNHEVYTRLEFFQRVEETMSDHSVLAERVANVMPKILAAMIDKGNEDTYFQTTNNNAYHLPMDMVNAYVKDFVNRHVFHCVHFWHKAIPAPGLTPPRLTAKDSIHYSLDLDIVAQKPGGPMYDARLLTVRMSLWYPQGFMTYYKTDPISV
jgi:hypothetical protein